MLRPLIRQELLAHLMSARFLAAVVITLVLVVANTGVLLDEHERRVASYSQQEKVHHQKAVAAETYSMLKLFVERPPNPLSLFSAGLGTWEPPLKFIIAGSRRLKVSPHEIWRIRT